MKQLKKILIKLNKLKKSPKKNQEKKFFNFYFLKYFIFLISALFLIINIYYSQNLSKIFFSLVNFDKKATVEFLEKIRNEKNFYQQLKYYENIYGKDIKNHVFQKENEKKQMIKKLEQILEKNPKSRDALYYLFLLTGDKNYFYQAKQIDPEIK